MKWEDISIVPNLGVSQAIRRKASDLYYVAKDLGIKVSPYENKIETARGRFHRPLVKGKMVFWDAYGVTKKEGDELEFQFNPTEIGKTRDIEYNVDMIPGGADSLISYIGQRGARVSFELLITAPANMYQVPESFIDKQVNKQNFQERIEVGKEVPTTSEYFNKKKWEVHGTSFSTEDLIDKYGVVSAFIGIFDSKITPKERFEPPPYVEFIFSEALRFKGFITNVRYLYEAFDYGLRPIRARLALDIILGEPKRPVEAPIQRTTKASQETVTKTEAIEWIVLSTRELTNGNRFIDRCILLHGTHALMGYGMTWERLEKILVGEKGRKVKAEKVAKVNGLTEYYAPEKEIMMSLFDYLKAEGELDGHHVVKNMTDIERGALRVEQPTKSLTFHDEVPYERVDKYYDGRGKFKFQIPRIGVYDLVGDAVEQITYEVMIGYRDPFKKDLIRGTGYRTLG